MNFQSFGQTVKGHSRDLDKKSKGKIEQARKVRAKPVGRNQLGVKMQLSLSSLPKNSIDSWNKCKDAFISKYFPPAKIISLRNDIMNFKQLDHEHVAQAWDRMKLMIRNCPTHGLNLWMIIQKIMLD